MFQKNSMIQHVKSMCKHVNKTFACLQYYFTWTSYRTVEQKKICTVEA